MAERKPATASCVATFRKNGDVYAISHAHKATGYKAQPSSSNFDGTTTYKNSYCHAAGLGSTSKPLVPYNANSARNRLPVQFTGDAGAKRNGTGAKKDNPISGGTRDSAARFVTTNQRTFVQHKGTPIGYSNQGIVAEQSKWIHKRQAD
jgi:hypothetical protein|uniref:Uncharacterized protein n=1 Tax=Eutreptiella gymnastica TaxID=73025 RepID=A0A7S4C7X4_9EUGL|mmetsp:Transcript_101942/g.172731  ORF Transcript_101942/g.172731 Transcript_101942/m.172731 type:complete len:149 (+) Transcript_101942:55-501(+)